MASLVRAAPAPCPDGLCLRTRASLSPQQVGLELGPLLSHGSSIFGPGDPRWANATARYQEYPAPDFTVAVLVAQESDVAVVVKYANSNSLPLYAVKRRYALPISQARFKGFEVDMQLLTGIDIHPSRGSAAFQGGTYDRQVMDTLWEHDYEGTTGSCDCGFYRMISDNIRCFTSHADLFWGMRGAGHSFGIVTSFEMNIYPRQFDSWYYKIYVFTQDTLEPLFEQLNRLNGNGTQPVELAVQYGLYTLDPTVSATEAIIWWTFAYAGTQSEAQLYLTPFDELNPLSTIDGNVQFPQVPDVQGTGVHNTTCGKGLSRITGPAGLQVYNTTTQRQPYGLFNYNINEYPALNASGVVIEGYSVAGVRRVESDSSTYPFRDDYLLCKQSTITYKPNPRPDPIAIQWAEDNQRLWNKGQPTRKPHAYVNYASGTESLEETYGHEPWRLRWLRKLKAQDDPEGRFSY
ncbi:FAD-binding domain-containing protein [Aspergillus pseudoustus]|uniref:FAD-binding domain-containing protein n=1 Tax=Aspergillus pseudoustus TaxID=1810923 RepID=A0ABR4J1T2_9EURO